jgi:hypothetical protein
MDVFLIVPFERSQGNRFAGILATLTTRGHALIVLF